MNVFKFVVNRVEQENTRVLLNYIRIVLYIEIHPNVFTKIKNQKSLTVFYF